MSVFREEGPEGEMTGQSIIRVERLCVYGHHGVLPEETRLGQRFVIDLEICADTRDAVEGDDYTQAVCYAALCERVVALVSGPPVRLIETLADRIARDLLGAFPTIARARIRVGKPGAPIAHGFDTVSVETTLWRQRSVGFSLGCNMGDRAAALRMAVTWLGLAPGLEIEAVSGLYRTAPWGVTDQPDFYNLCVTGRTSLAPHALLRLCKEIETRLGRTPGMRWGARAMDVDLLYLDDCAVSDSVLTLPHPHMTGRAFVLVPLAEIAPAQKISGQSVSDMLDRLPRAADDAVPCTDAPFCLTEDQT